jgi:colicin import membrane protein
MNVKTLPRTAVDTYLRLLRVPVDTAARVAHRVQGDDRSAVTEIAIDRADALVRDVAGRVLRDDELREEAHRRRTAADERERALRLHDAAQTQSELAREQFTEARAEAEAARRAAREEAQRIEQQAEETKRQREQQAAQTAGKRKAAVRQMTAAVEEQVEELADVRRLDALETKTAALDAQEEALATADEADRLQQAAAKRKAARKA